jgi:predicted nucleic acid-binding protein
VKPFLDTNVLVYALSPGEDPRQPMARELLARWAPGAWTINTQVLGETYNALVTRRHYPAKEALAAVRVLARMHVWVPAADTVIRALELAASHTLSTWDAMIVQAAIESGCDTLFTEDLQTGRRFDTVEVVNPFELKAHEPAPKTAKPRTRRR